MIRSSALLDALGGMVAELEAEGNEQQKVTWQPFPNSPQEQAYYSEADHLFYGGAAGGGKTDLGLGLAANEHKRSILFRRTIPQTRAMVERSRNILNPSGVNTSEDSFNENLRRWKMADGRLIEFGSIQHAKNVTDYQGRPHDLYVFDEVTEFTEYMFRFVIGWNRTEIPNQRCRVVATGNPPTTADGEWVLQYWGAWLDESHPNPARAGELRWYHTIDGEDVEVAEDDYLEVDGDLIKPTSRTFIPARVQDNPIYMETGYMATLSALPEPLRSKMLYGDFSIGSDDDPWQVIPTQWVLDAQERYRNGKRPPVQPRSVGVDVAYGGKDKTAVAQLYGNWFEIETVAGKDTSDGREGAAIVQSIIDGYQAPLFVDAIGYGASTFERLQDNPQLKVTGVNVGASADGRTDRSGKFQFSNIRAEMFWRLREALDPANGEEIALPDDRELRVELCAATYSISTGRIKIEAKDKIKERLGRSPDKADALALAWWGANKSNGGVVTMAAPQSARAARNSRQLARRRDRD